MRTLILFAALTAGMLTVAQASYATDDASALTLRNKQFEPRELTVPQGVKVKLVVHNMDKVAAEFESYDLSREVVIGAQGQATIYIGPLKPGRYRFFNDFNRDMQGWIVVKDATADKK